VTVTVAGQPWEQVASLRDSRPTDRHYEVRHTEDGHLTVTFGDGVHGRRLPTGTNNVRVAYRVGAGLAGNLPAGSLTTPVQPSPRVAGVLQPLAATGGDDREEVDALRTEAPKSVLTLDRAVSLSDLAARAASQAGVWQARAFALPTGGGRHASVEVVVVPAGGGTLGTLAADLTAFLLDRALPGVEVRVTAFEPRPFDLEVELEVSTASQDEQELRKLVRAALLDRFGLRRRALGASVYASEVYAVVDGVVGVESSRLRMGFGKVGDVRVLRATDRQVVHLDPVRSRLDLSVREYVL
jgi:predicted phage baseplate assembly protein